jgi:hypothetical protein
MRKSPIVALVTCFICSASFAPGAHTQVDAEKTGTVKKTTAGCPSYQYLTNFLLTFSLAGEEQAMAAFQRYQCVVLHREEAVTIRQRQNDRVCVRRLNDSDCYWMESDDLESDGG